MTARQDLVERFAALGIEAQLHPGETGRGKVWLIVGFRADATGRRLDVCDHSGEPIRSNGKHTGGNCCAWSLADAERLLEQIEGAT